MKKVVLVFALVFGFTTLSAQDSSKVNPVTISGYAEMYYSYDLASPANHQRPSFFYNFNRHNEANLNFGFIKANYSETNVRGNFALMAGTYAHYNLAGEQALLRNIFEANAGLKLSKKNNIWLDIGIMPSHIGFESAVGKDCWNLTRCILGDNSPYYEAGAKLGYTSKNDKLYLSVMYLNGWQRIQRIPGNQTPAGGTQITYKPNSNIALNWSTYAGNEQPDSLKLWRYFNNFYGVLQVTEKFGIIAGFDVGIQQKVKDSSAYANWYAPILLLQYKPTSKIKIAARGEYYADENGVIIATGTKNGFKVLGYSLNLDYSPTSNVMLRIEGRGLSSIDEIFSLDNKPSTQNYFITTSLSFAF
jgi:hypothetical protein